MDVDENFFRLYYYYGIIFGLKEVCRDFINGINGEFNYLGVKNCIVDCIMMMFVNFVK